MDFRTPLFLCLLLDLDTHGGVDPLGVFPLFLKMVADITAPKLSIIFRLRIRRGSFPECWESANVTAIRMGAHSPGRENYSSISITPIMSKNKQTILFPQDMIQDIYKLHWNIIHKSTGVT